MSVYQNSKFRYMVMKTEGASQGTDATPSTTERVIRIRDIKTSIDPELDDENVKYSDGTHAEDQSVVGVQKGTIQCSVRCCVGSTQILAPQWWTLAKACGMTTTSAYSTDKGIGLVRRLAKDDATYTIWVSNASIGASQTFTFQKYVGCIGNMQIGCDKVGGVWTAKYNYFGKLTDIVDASDLALTAPDLNQPQAYLSHTASINGVSESISAWQLDLGNVINPVPLQSDATGISHYVITESHPRFSCNPLAVKQATKDWWAELLAKPTTNNLILGTPAASKLSISSADMQLLTMAEAEVGGLNAWAMNFKLLPNGVTGALLDASLTYEDCFEILQGTRS